MIGGATVSESGRLSQDGILGLELPIPPRDVAESRLTGTSASEPYEVRCAFLARAELEADHGVAIEGFGESAQGVGVGAVLAALDAGDHRLGGAHTFGEVLLGQVEVCSTHDDDAGDLFERSKSVLCLLVGWTLVATLADVFLDAGSDRTAVVCHVVHLANQVSSSAIIGLRGVTSYCSGRRSWVGVHPLLEVVPPLLGEPDLGGWDLGGSLYKDVQEDDQSV